MIDLKEQAGVAMNVRSQLGESIGDPKVTLGALAFADELGNLLWRMKYGQDIRRAGMHRATLLLANRIRSSGKFNRSKFTGRDAKSTRDPKAREKAERALTDIIERFALRLLVEWIADMCVECGGRGIAFGHAMVPSAQTAECHVCDGTGRLLELEEFIPFLVGRHGPLPIRHYVRCEHCLGRGIVQVKRRVSHTQVCTVCDGSRRAPVDEAARALALGVSLPVYRRHWASYFHGVLAVLDRIDGSAADVVRRRTRA
ncbi:hypothetical protein PQR71_12920 [Paraburkholderia fungorum]|uniref:hypothetical protein n=1 Tax=Paraburkholderia fungorum TaxID=134537 RepID=UPI0038B97B59